MGRTLYPYLHESRVPVHFRRQFREGLVARLKAQVPLVEGRVFASRHFGPAPGESPCIILSTPSDAPALQERGKRLPMRRDVVANMLVYARETERVDDDLDAVCVQIEACLDDAKAVHPALEDLQYGGTQMPVVEGEVQHGVYQVAYVGSYYVTPWPGTSTSISPGISPTISRARPRNCAGR